MNLIYYIFFVVYFFSTSNQVESRLSHVKVTHKKGAKIYTVGGKKFKTFRNAYSYNKRRSKLLKKKPIRKPIRRLTRKNTGRQINRIIKRRPTSKPNRYQPILQPLISRHQPTQPPIIATTTTKVDKIAKYIETYYNVTNNFRIQHKVPTLRVTDLLVKRAKECAERFSREKNTWLSPDPEYALNFAQTESDNPDDAVEHWYGESKNYDYDRPVWGGETKNFIHMIWKSATDMGCGIVFKKEYFICCEYFPIGNINDQKTLEENVLKPQN